jgi:hypothetical protein
MPPARAASCSSRAPARCAWAADNIQANAVLPGWIDTDLTKRARKEIDGLHDRVLARTPAARWGVISDFAGIAVFLASPASDFVTGTAIPVDGGFSSWDSPVAKLARNSRSLRRLHMLGPHAEPEEARRDALQPGHRRDQPHDQRDLQRLIARLQRGADDVVLHHDLHPLRHPHRKLAAPAHGVEFVLGRAAVRQLRRQQVGGRDRVLHREIDADAADRRHRMRGIADAQQPGRVQRFSRLIATVSSFTSSQLFTSAIPDFRIGAIRATSSSSAASPSPSPRRTAPWR